ncbi:MAG: tetratricopeptide repeat protein [Alphaproteobacteria bacterium]|nr:tetratricopeptide repeat protein [Alphaproteobacteria bacterium]
MGRAGGPLWFNHYRLAAARAEWGCSQEQAAEELKVSLSTYQRHEHGRVNEEGYALNTSAKRTLLRNLEALWGVRRGDLLLSEPPVPPASLPEEAPAVLLTRKSNLPPRRHGFVGRAVELERLHALLQISDEDAIGLPVALVGLGGVGKTLLAIEYAYRHLDSYEHVCWVHADGDDVSASMAGLAWDPFNLGLPADVKTRAALRTVRARLERAGPHLLILDNVEHPRAWREVLPAVGDVRVLVTTRRSDLCDVESISVCGLPRRQSLALLGGRKRRPGLDKAASDQLCEALADHTLAVAVAGRLLENPFSSAEALLEEVSASGPVAWSDAQEVVEELMGTHSLTRVFEASLRQLRPSEVVDELARATFFIAGWLAPVELEPGLLQQIVTALMEHPADPRVLARALGRLAALGLVQRGKDGGVVVHRLLREFARLRGGGGPREAVLDHLQARAEGVSRDMMELLSLGRLRAHMASLSAVLTERDPPGRRFIPMRLAQHLYCRGEWSVALAVVEAALSNTSGVWRGRLLRVRGEILQVQGEYRAALSCQSESTEIMLEFLPDARLEHAINDTNVGLLRFKLGQYPLALASYQRALDARLAVQGEHHPDVAMMYQYIGATLGHLGRYAEASAVTRRALAIARTSLPEGHPEMEPILNSLGHCLRRQGLYQEALYIVSDVLERTQASRGRQHLETAKVCSTKGQLLRLCGRYPEALDCYERAREVTENVAGPMHPHVGYILQGVGRIMLLRGRLEDALEVFEQATDALVRGLGEAHPDLAVVWMEKGRVLSHRGDHEAALAWQQAALARREGCQGAHHPLTADVISALGETLLRSGRPEEARMVHVRALSSRRRMLGEAHPLTAESHRELALVDEAVGAGSDAVERFRRALAIQRGALGVTHPETAVTTAQLAICLERSARRDEAREQRREALSALAQTHGPDHHLVGRLHAFLLAKEHDRSVSGSG